MNSTEPDSNQIYHGQVYRQMGLSDDEYKLVVELLGRRPNLTETGIFGVMWSEHCSYKNSKPLLSRFPVDGPEVLQGPGEGAGVVDIGDGYAVVFKVESHNHPSAIEPYQGAATGVGGILRDIFSMGARPIAVLNSLRFGPLSSGNSDSSKSNVSRTRYLFGHVVAGIAGYGNCIGVPTVGGEVCFDECYSGNPLVNAMGVGILRHEQLQHGRAEGIGKSVIYVGAATGRDGIHGATFASEELNQNSDAKRPAVQVGDPFMGKLLIEACLEVYESGAIYSVQDMGAAGLTCSSTEMSDKGGVGMELNLNLVPQRAEKMSAYEIMLSESQERMLFVANPGREEDIFAICKKWDVPAVTVGHLIEEPVLRLKHHSETVAELPLKTVCGATPIYQREAKMPQEVIERQQQSAISWEVPEDLNSVFEQLIQTPQLASKSWIYQQYDFMVRTNTAVCPGSDAAVVRVEGTDKALAMSIDGNSRYVFLDPRTGGKIAVAEAARNVVCSGARPLAITDGLNFGNPEKPEIFWQLEQAVSGMAEACNILKLPVTGGNVSLYNETEGEAIYPTPVVGAVGLIENNVHTTTQYFKNSGDVLLLLGETKNELGGSAYQQMQLGNICGLPPELDLNTEQTLQQTLLEIIRSGIVNSAHDLSQGGLALVLLTSCTENYGIAVDLKSKLRPDVVLFSESQSRVLLSVAPENVELIDVVMQKKGVPCFQIGKVLSAETSAASGTPEVGSFEISLNNNPVIQADLQSLRNLWQNAIGREMEHSL
ncbi:MAG: phosphoribosylformylglycinamidine synthase subunit PurL [SAR324 cluster bacterium]|nr:phosphoribosylformylglycinamidine synthase subunit PurL [SAR324 cluster bacterium]MBL7034771.1 phosphoribosylformylglycinamidine synthase subunit PurL [SAR324 cluster bacterium]